MRLSPFPILLLIITSILPGARANAQSGDYTMHSPDNRTIVRVGTRDSLTLSVSRDGQELFVVSPPLLQLEGKQPLGANPRIRDTMMTYTNETIHPVVPEKRNVIPNIYREMTLRFMDGWSFIVRAYDDGVAYRFRTNFPGEIQVTNEHLSVHLAVTDSIWFPREDSFLSHSERLYQHLAIANLADSQMCCLPAVVEKTHGPRIAITESDLFDYPGLYLKGTRVGEPVLASVLPAYPLEEQFIDDRTCNVTRRAPYIARTRGTRSFPWRVFAIAEKDGDLVGNDIVYRLGSPTLLQETSWIKPGKVAWDWWNANNIYGVPFKSGLNTATYQYYIDFASDNKIEYVIFDEGWSKPSDLFVLNPNMDMDSLFRYARKKNVGIILWVTWNALRDRMTEALDRFAAWGAAGIKVDFMQRDDQVMVNFYERTAKEAARRHMLVDFHGSFKPTGFSRTYPNALTREGVRGQEWSKWSKDITPMHTVTLPFTRMVAGAMDFTPGAMRNAAQGNFTPIFSEPMSQGTRCHQLAMYIVYESPLQMLCDSPSDYQREPRIMEFLSAVPTTWDETRVIDGEIGEYIMLARRKGSTWYVGAITNWTPRDVLLNLDFMGEGPATVYEDGPNADRRGVDYSIRTAPLKKGEPVKIHLAPGGGAVVWKTK